MKYEKERYNSKYGSLTLNTYPVKYLVVLEINILKVVGQ